MLRPDGPPDPPPFPAVLLAAAAEERALAEADAAVVFAGCTGPVVEDAAPPNEKLAVPEFVPLGEVEVLSVVGREADEPPPAAGRPLF